MQSYQCQSFCSYQVGLTVSFWKTFRKSGVSEKPAPGAAVHIEAAADAVRLAATYGTRGIYNIAEPGETLSSAKANAELGWNAGFRFEG